MRRMVEAGAIDQGDAFGAFYEQEMIDRRFGKRGEPQHDIGGEAALRDRKFRPPQMRRRTGRGEDVVDQGEMQHFLQRDLAQGTAPAIDRRQFFRRDALFGAALQAPHGVEVGAHDAVLEFRRLGEEIKEFLAILDDNGFVHRWPASSSGCGTRSVPQAGREGKAQTAGYSPDNSRRRRSSSSE